MGVAKSLRYLLSATCLSKKDCETVDKKLLAAALPALGFPPKYRHKIAQAPPEALGLGIPSIWNDQGINHVTAMLRHGDSNPKNITGCLFRDAMTTLRFELGLPGYPFDHSYKCGQKSLHSPTSQPATANTSLRNAKKKISLPNCHHSLT
jgi:hypothetical protein